MWDAYWGDEQSPARILTPADMGPASRWIDAVDRYLRALAEADERPLVKGSTGQSVRNPLYDVAEKALATAERCEHQLGIGPSNRAALGIAVISEQRSLAEMNARYAQEADDDGPDPRLRVIEG